MPPTMLATDDEMSVCIAAFAITAIEPDITEAKNFV
jgi:hypothetical protein